jgi:hypothetical protein
MYIDVHTASLRPDLADNRYTITANRNSTGCAG